MLRFYKPGVRNKTSYQPAILCRLLSVKNSGFARLMGHRLACRRLMNDDKKKGGFWVKDDRSLLSTGIIVRKFLICLYSVSFIDICVTHGLSLCE